MKLGNLNTGLSTKFSLPGRVGKKKHKHVILKKGAKLVGKGLFKLLQLIASNPYSLVIFITVVVGSIAYLIYSIDYQLTQIMVQYQALSARPTDSKAGYDKRVVFVITDANGNATLTVGYQSEAAEEEAKQALEEAGVIGSMGGGDLPHFDYADSKNEIQRVLTNAGYNISQRKLDSISYLYQAMYMDGPYSYEYTLAVMGRSMVEGEPGRLEDCSHSSGSHGLNKYLRKINAGSDEYQHAEKLIECYCLKYNTDNTYPNTIDQYTADEVENMYTLSSSIQTTGFGIGAIQMSTNAARTATYAALVTAYSDGILDQDEILAADWAGLHTWIGKDSDKVSTSNYTDMDAYCKAVAKNINGSSTNYDESLVNALYPSMCKQGDTPIY